MSFGHNAMGEGTVASSPPFMTIDSTAATSSKREKALQFVRSMLVAIQRETDIERAVLISEWLARFLFSNYFGVYRLDQLEEVLVSKVPSQTIVISAQRKAELHIASELYAHGGHTRLLKALVAQGRNNPEVLLTRVADRKHILDILAIADSRLHIVDGSSARQQVHQIASIAAGYEMVVLHIHPDDVICALALHSIKRSGHKIHIAMVNHSDHTFSVGIGLADVLLEVSTFGWALRASRDTEGKSSFIGIPIQTGPISEGDVRVPALLFSAGSAYKFKPNARASLPASMRVVLQQVPSTRLLVVGPRRTDYWWWSLKLRFWNRVDISNRVPHEDHLRHLKNCDVYVDSFPITGGTAFTEALLHGCNVAGLVGPSFGYGAADSLRSRTAEALTNHIAGLIGGVDTIISRQQEVRAVAAHFHFPAAVRKRLDETRNSGILHQPPTEFAINVPYRSFETTWAQASKVMAPGFRTSRQLRVFPTIVVHLSKAFGLHVWLLVPLLAKAAFAAVMRTK